MSENLPAHSKLLLFFFLILSLYSVTLNSSPLSLVLLSPVSQWEKIHCPKGWSFQLFFFFPQSLSGLRNKVDFFFFFNVEVFSPPQHFPPGPLSHVHLFSSHFHSHVVFSAQWGPQRRHCSSPNRGFYLQEAGTGGSGSDEIDVMRNLKQVFLAVT